MMKEERCLARLLLALRHAGYSPRCINAKDWTMEDAHIDLGNGIDIQIGDTYAGVSAEVGQETDPTFVQYPYRSLGQISLLCRDVRAAQKAVQKGGQTT